MIVKKLMNGGEKQLFLKKCNAPFYRTGNTFGLTYPGDLPVCGAKPDPEALAIPNGCGYRQEGERSRNYIFRRIDRVWINIQDERVARVVEVAVENLREGLQLTFEDLQGMAGVDRDAITIVYSAGILGFHDFNTTPEKLQSIRIENGWFEDHLFEYMVYRNGLALYELFHKSMPHIMFAYYFHKVKLAAELKVDALVLRQCGGNGIKSGCEVVEVVVEDDYLVELAKDCDGFTVGEVRESCSRIYVEEVMWGLAVLVGLGCINLDPTFSPQTGGR